MPPIYARLLLITVLIVFQTSARVQVVKRLALHNGLRHVRHHHLSNGGNFGVTAGVWDHVFGTALEGRTSKV